MAGYLLADLLYLRDKTGYGLTKDEGILLAASGTSPRFYAQWELDSRDGRRLQIEGPSQQATIRYGVWNNRDADIIHSNVSFPFVLDPQADGLSTQDQEYYVISILFEDAPATDEPIYLTIVP